ncbi:MAG: phage tail tip lysozyme [Carnobacterium sp.]|uniref:phage tail tip lysozyme n=2 Tax=Carnobacteriaceae TaxID=186828 RepID=UPI0009C67497|nr:phage tail tip lysozyme [Carnobacterium maltaromaticum]CRH18690.1 hypothetical protein CM318V1_270002 [Carnobacterium maltaromaticum]
MVENATENAKQIFSFFRAKGWTAQSICGMLGNMQGESGIIADKDEYGGGGGYGLVQWTPKSNLVNWANSNGLNYRTVETQCKRIQWELDNNQQFYSTSSYPLNFRQYTQSSQSPTYLAAAFISNYERPANNNQPQRGVWAEEWFRNLNGSVNPPTGTARLDQQYGIDIFNITQAKAVEMVPKLQETFALTFLSDIVSIVQSNNAYEIKVVALTKPQAVKYVPVIQRLVAGTVPNYNLMDTFGVPQSNGSFWIRAINIRTANEANKLIPLIRRTVALDLMGPFVFGTTIDGKQGIRMKHLSKNEAEIIQQQIVKKWPELDMHTRIEFGK